MDGKIINDLVFNSRALQTRAEDIKASDMTDGQKLDALLDAITAGRIPAFPPAAAGEGDSNG